MMSPTGFLKSAFEASTFPHSGQRHAANGWDERVSKMAGLFKLIHNKFAIFS